MAEENAGRPVSGGAPQAAPSAPPPLTGATLALGTVALSLATFMNVLDTSIANVSIPAIAGDLGVSPDQGTWVITSFAVANGISVPLTGWLTRRFGQVKLFTAAVVLFVVASMMCALAPTLSLLVVWVGAMQIMLDKGKDLDWFNSTAIVALACVAVIGFAIFLIWELTEDHPIVDLSLFRSRNFTVSTIAMLFAYGLFFGNVVLLPLWLQQYMGYTATLAGWVLAPVGVLAILLSPVVGRFNDRVDPRILVTISFAIFALVLFMRAHFNTDATIATLMLPTVIQGAGMAAFFIPLVSISLSGMSPERIPAASGLFNFARITAGAFGTSITTTLWDRRATLHHAQLVERLNAGDPTTAAALGTLHSGGLSADQSYAMLNRLVDTQAFMLSANDIFYASGILFLLLIFLVWLAHPVRGAGGAAAASGAH